MATMDRRLTLAAALLLPTLALAQGPAPLGRTSYPDRRGGQILLPRGDASFADAAVAVPTGSLSPASHNRAEAALGPPDFRRMGDGRHVTLGCRSELRLRFERTAPTDGPGPDLFVFEVGDAPEGMEVWISTDGTQWLRAGATGGGVSGVDLAGVALPGTSYPYVRLVDLGQRCDGPWPGADVDAVASVGARGDEPRAQATPAPAPGAPEKRREIARTQLRDSVLFDLDRAALRPDAPRRLQGVVRQVRQFPGAQIVVEGHTCSLGSVAHNEKLSKARAEAIRRFLVTKAGAAASSIECRGYGESRPAAPNTSEEGRRRNRRVEIVFYAPLPAPEAEAAQAVHAGP